MNDIVIGDVVRLKSSGPRMTVIYMRGDGGQPYANCVWFSGEELKSGPFPLACLYKTERISVNPAGAETASAICQMTLDEKRAKMAQAVQTIRAVMMLLGDPHPIVSAEIIDTDPEPMSGPYIQIAAACKILLEDKR